MPRSYDWAFPLPRTHTGILQGNGLLGSMLWGEGNVLNLTLGRGDFWDHRGGLPWTQMMNYEAIGKLLEAGDEKGLRALFEQNATPPGQPARPTLLPLGRLELVLEAGHRLGRATLDMDSGDVIVRVVGRDGHEHRLSFTLSMHQPLIHVRYPRELGVPQVRGVTSWRYLAERLKAMGIEEPQNFQQSTFLPTSLDEGMDQPDLVEEITYCGWVQKRPVDAPLCVAWRIHGEDLWIATALGDSAADAQGKAIHMIDQARQMGFNQMRSQNVSWWSTYWQHAAEVELPNSRLQFLYDYGMYKFACMSNPSGVAAGLQGPWIEEYQLPPWSGDYHFNINVQMCYGPAYQGNRLEHVRPLLDMVWSWREKLREIARLFIGVEDGYMLPHAVDDRCVNMGGFWTGTIDHGCTAWVAKMMYDYWLFGGDKQYLASVAYPFMAGAMRVYQAMLQKKEGVYRLPVSVSPEYRGSQLNAWGANASFQLAAIHWLCEKLQHAAEVLGQSADPAWSDISQNLPKVCLIPSGPEGRFSEIGLWEGTGLEESHRHHSHLAAIAPFDVIDPLDKRWRAIVDQSLLTWISRGMGHWSGWCMPWASQIHSRVGNADMAELTLQIWQSVFTNEGHGTLHDCQFAGFTLIGSDGTGTGVGDKSHEIMQMDAGMGVVSAILDMLLHARRGVHYLFAGSPANWPAVSFSDIRAEGGFLISARRAEGKVSGVHITATQSGVFRLANPWAKAAQVRMGTPSQRLEGRILELQLKKGQSVELSQAED